MKIMIKLFATLRDGRFDVRQMDFPDGATVTDVIRSLGIREEEAPIVFVDSRNADLDRELHEGNTVAIFPPIGGG